MRPLLLIALAGACLAVVGCGSTDAEAPSTVPPRDIIAAVAGALGPDAPLTLHADITSSEPDTTADGVDLMPSRTTFDFAMNRTGLHLVLSDWPSVSDDPERREIVVTEAGQYLRDPAGKWVYDPSMTLHITRKSLAELSIPNSGARGTVSTVARTLANAAPKRAIQMANGEHCVRGPLDLAALPKDGIAMWSHLKSADIDFCVTRGDSGVLAPVHASLSYTAAQGVVGAISAAVDTHPPTIVAPDAVVTDREKATRIGLMMLLTGTAAVTGPFIDTSRFNLSTSGTGSFNGVVTSP